MISALGAKYTGYMTRTNSVLVCRRYDIIYKLNSTFSVLSNLRNTCIYTNKCLFQSPWIFVVKCIQIILFMYDIAYVLDPMVRNIRRPKNGRWLLWMCSGYLTWFSDTWTPWKPPYRSVTFRSDRWTNFRWTWIKFNI